jgi:hypothetical protein
MAFTYGVKLPGFNNKKIWVKEINSGLYKDLVKSLYNNDSTEFLYHLNLVIEHVSPGILQEGLNVVDKIILLLQIRSICISPDLKLKATCPDTGKEFECEIKIEELVSKLENISYTKVVQHQNITITHSIVKAIDEINFINILPDKLFSYQLASCIDLVILKETEVCFKQLQFEERLKIVENLPLSITTKVFDSLTNVEKELSQLKLLAIQSPWTASNVVSLPVSTDTNVLLEFCKLIFNDDLINLYKINLNLVYRANFTPEYVDNITPAEQLLYWTLYVQQIQKEHSEATSTTKPPGYSDGNSNNIGFKVPEGFT